jgi:transketolase
MGSYLQKIEAAKKKHPTIAAEYESIFAEIMQKEKLANEAWGVFTENEENYLAKRQYYYDVIKPLNDKLETLWNKLFSKDETEINERQEVRSYLY